MVIGVFYFLKKEGRGVSALAKQKLTLAFIAIALVLAIAGYLLQGTSLAWFAVSGEVEANGMTLSANVPANLIISKTAEGLISNAGFLVEFKDSDGRDEMIAVTRDENYTPTYLKRLVSHYAIDATTGLLKDGLDGELEFEAVEASENSKYYVDYVVYVASAYAPLNATSLTATISMPTEVDAFTPYHNAASIDFYVGEVSLDGYRGTTSVATKAEVELLDAPQTIPLNTGGEYIKVIMRCYFDGALTDSASGKAYVNTRTVGVESIALGIDFKAVGDN